VKWYKPLNLPFYPVASPRGLDRTEDSKREILSSVLTEQGLMSVLTGQRNPRTSCQQSSPTRRTPSAVSTEKVHHIHA